MGGDLSEQYRNAMRPHRAFGYPLYEPVPCERLFPGVLGYIDDKHQWHPLLDLTKTPIFDVVSGKAVKDDRYTPINIPVGKKPDSRLWGPLASSKHREEAINIETEADALALALPVTIGGAIEYSSRVDFGAILMCDDEVTAKGFDIHLPFIRWIKDNSPALLEDFPDLQRHGTIIATGTYSAEKIKINAWEGTEHKIVLGFNVGATGIGHVGPGTTWVRGRTSHAWSGYTDGPRVVFFSGAKIKYTAFGPREQVEDKWRGETGHTFLAHKPGTGDDAASQFSRAEIELFGEDYAETMKK